MKTGIRHYENATCKISICTAIPNQMRARTRELTSLDVPENLRKQGMATELMRNVCDEADAHNMTIVLFVKPFGEGTKLDETQLREWYQTAFGFMILQAKPMMMARMPHSTPKPFKPNLIMNSILKQDTK